MKKTILLSIALFATLICFNACQKNNDPEEAQITAIAEDLTTNEEDLQQTEIDADIAIEERGGGSCATVTFAQPYGTWPNTITIEYAGECKRLNNRVFKGKVIIQQSAEIRTPGAQRTITYENFTIDGVQLTGTRTWINNGKDANGNWSYTKTGTDLKRTFPDGTTRTWNATHTSIIIEGGATATYWDDVWSTTGTATGINRNGDAFTVNITTPLVKSATCAWISAGEVTFTRGTRTATLNYGNGECERFGTLTLPSGDTRKIILRK